MKLNSRSVVLVGMALAMLAAFLIVWAQEYPTFRGSNGRVGRQTGDLLADTPGRMFIRWWDPLLTLTTELDNWDTSVGGSKPYTTQDPFGSWDAPEGAEASAFVDQQAGEDPYVYTGLVPSASTERFWQPAAGQSAKKFNWVFPGMTVGQEVSLYVNIPIGPTEVGARGEGNYVYPQRYFVYEVSGVANPDGTTEPYREMVDTYAAGGGFVRLGNGGLTTDRMFLVNDTIVKITLINTIPRDSGGELTDTRSNIVVYADAAAIMSSVESAGATVAQPVVGQLTASDPYANRVYSTRNEPQTLQVGSQIRNYTNGVVTSFRHNGLKIDATEPGVGGDARRNIVWSWPARRPFDLTAAEEARYTAEKRDFILGLGATPGPSRANESVTVDNLSAGVSATFGWISDTAVPGYKGDDYLRTDVVSGAATGRVFFRPVLKSGDYSIYTWVPGPNNVFASEAQVEIYSGAFLVGTASVNQLGGPGWVQVKLNNQSEFTNYPAAPLYVAVTNRSDQAADAGRQVAADMVRFVKQADLDVKSTPVFTTAHVRVGGSLVQRDVVVVAMENGRLYCLDAKGTYDANGPTGSTTVYWTYPSELPNGVSDPNQAAGLDGPGGIATMPLSWDLSSALVAPVTTENGVEELLYIGTTNGRVFCIEMAGRGDGVPGSHYGTTRRRWSFPNDYPAEPSALDLGPIVGSVAFQPDSSGGNGTVFVPTTNGRLYALDAAGDGVNRVTSIRWQYPGPTDDRIGSITMTPAVEFGKVYFGTGGGGVGGVGDNTFYALSATDSNADGVGDVVWTSTGGSVGFSAFNHASPATVPATVVQGGMPNTVYLANPNGYVYALNADDGTLIWETNEIGTTASGSLSFSYATTYQTDGTLDSPAPPGRPIVLVPGQDGRYSALFARLGDVNRDNGALPVATGIRMAWQYRLEGQQATSLALGARDSAVASLFDDEHSWMYGCDDRGYLYAFNYDPDFPDNDQIISPGMPPGREDLVANDPTASNLRDVVYNAKVQLILPAEYTKLNVRKRGQPAYDPDIQAAIAANKRVTRRFYEYGESLYVLVYDLPDFSYWPTPMNYTLEFQFNSPGASAQRRVVTPLLLLNGAGQKNGRYALFQFAVTGTGNNAMTPGAANMQIRAQTTRTSGRQQGQTANLSIPNTSFSPSPNFTVANPLALSIAAAPTAAQSIGFVLDPSSNEVRYNGNRVDADPTNEKWLTQPFGPDAGNLGDRISHGQTAVSKLWVWDRSLMTLLLGEKRGIQNVRFFANPLYWNLAGAAPKDTIFKLLNPNIYQNFEELPAGAGANTSPDYPDLRREALVVTKQLYGDVENPLYQPVGLEPPTIDPDQRKAYNETAASYNAYLNRNLQSTVFDLALDVPRFQPPSLNGYLSNQIVFVDANQSGRQFSGGTAQEAYRAFFSRADIAVDERLSVGTPTVDLGSIPSGGGFTPLAPWNDPAFSLTNPLFNTAANAPFFQRFSVFNEGNVNLLNLRVAKSVVGQPWMSQLGAANLSDRAWLDAPLHLHSDLDPRFAPTLGANVLSVVLQKARPGDGVPTRLRVNPIRRANPNLNVNEAPLLDPIAYPLEDPKVAVSVPIGTPVGAYQQNVFVFEDRGASLPAPELGPDSNTITNPSGNPNVYEPYSDPGFSLKFTVRETRLTNRPTSKAAPMLETLDDGTARFLWANQQPAAIRDGNGNVIVVWSSNRLAAGGPSGNPGWAARPKTEADEANPDQWRLYASVLAGSTPTNLGNSPIRDLNLFAPAAPNRWFTMDDGLAGFPSAEPALLFNVRAGESIVAGSARYGLPAFPSGGVFNTLQPMGDSGRTASGTVYLAFVGEATKRTAQGDSVRESRLFVSPVKIGSNGQISIGAPEPLATGSGTDTNPADPQARFGRPSLIQVDDEVTVFFTTNAGGSSQINWAHKTGRGWSSNNGQIVESLRLTNSFETLGPPSATLRQSVFGPVIDLAFTGKLRGRPQSEVFFGRLRSDSNGQPRRGNQGLSIPWATRVDPLTYDPSTGVYWSQGAEWRGSGPDTSSSVGHNNVVADPLADSWIDILVAVPGGYRSVLDHSTKVVESNSRVLTCETTLGGQAVIDMGNGSVKFQGGIVPRAASMVVRYTPRFVRVSAGLGSNYRGAGLVFDERFTGENSYWFSQSGAPMNWNALARNDRYIFTYARTSADGSSQARPYYRTYRFGVELPDAVQTITDRTSPNYGRIAMLQVSGVVGFYQVDPISGKIYVSAENEGRVLTVRYYAVDEAGAYKGDYTVQLRVGLVSEMSETVVPVEQVANESAMSMALDPQNAPFNSQNVRRPGLVWLFWSSTRAGVPDVYFETIAPRFTARPSE